MEEKRKNALEVAQKEEEEAQEGTEAQSRKAVISFSFFVFFSFFLSLIPLFIFLFIFLFYKSFDGRSDEASANQLPEERVGAWRLSCNFV